MTTPNVLDKLRQTQSISAEQNSARRVNLYPSICRHCRFYQSEGRRGGHCQQMEALVRGSWQACALALPPFAPSWEAVSNPMQ